MKHAWYLLMFKVCWLSAEACYKCFNFFHILGCVDYVFSRSFSLILSKVSCWDPYNHNCLWHFTKTNGCIKAEDWGGQYAAVKLRQSKSFAIMCNNVLITDDYRYSMQLSFSVGNNKKNIYQLFSQVAQLEIYFRTIKMRLSSLYRLCLTLIQLTEVEMLKVAFICICILEEF